MKKPVFAFWAIIMLIGLTLAGCGGGGGGGGSNPVGPLGSDVSSSVSSKTIQNDVPIVLSFKSVPLNPADFITVTNDVVPLVKDTHYTIAQDGNKVTLKPRTYWRSGLLYKVKVDKNMADKEGKKLGSDIQVYFDVAFAGGDGSPDNPYQISNAGHLDSIRTSELCNKHYKQTANIDLSSYVSSYCTEEEGWLPIGNQPSFFTGSYDGDGKTIEGLWINRPEETSVGLFGTCQNATVKNLNVKVASDKAVAGKWSVGGIVGNIYVGTSRVMIENCYVTGKIMAESCCQRHCRFYHEWPIY